MESLLTTPVEVPKEPPRNEWRATTPEPAPVEEAAPVAEKAPTEKAPTKKRRSRKKRQ